MQPVLYHFNASQPQHTPAGKLLGSMYYGGFLEKVLARDEASGYPHNGGEHSLTLHLTPSSLESFLALVEESYPGHAGAPTFVESVRSRAVQRYPELARH